jgi:hypothetical protein
LEKVPSQNLYHRRRAAICSVKRRYPTQRNPRD